MKYTREYVKEQIDKAAAADPERRTVCVTLVTDDPKHEYMLSYDKQTRTVQGVIEKIGKTRKIPRSLSDILRS